MKRYFELTHQERIALTSDEFYTAVKLEAIDRGIKPPIALSQAINEFPLKGFSLPPDSVTLFEVVVADEYGSTGEGCGLAFRTVEAAHKAIEGAVALVHCNYSDPKVKFGDEKGISIKETYLTFTKSKSVGLALNQYEQDTQQFDELLEQCRINAQELQQAEYDARVMAEKRKQYMELAQGNEEIARAFWAKTEHTEFPAA